MTLRNFLAAAFLLCTSLVSGQNTILWKVTGPDSKNVSYLLGTYHFFGDSFVDSFPVIKEKLRTADVVITEVKLDRPKAIAYYNSRPASTALSSALSQSDIDYISTLLKNSEVDISKYTPGELFVKLQAAYPKFRCPAIGSGDRWVMDEYIQQMGGQQHKTLYFLESDSLQLDKIYQATKIYDWNFFKKAIPPLLAKYRSEAPDATLCALANQYASFTLDYGLKTNCNSASDELVKKRNEDWMQKLPALLEKNNCFVAVGLMHLYNKCGLIEQLRVLGYLVEEVPMK